MLCKVKDLKGYKLDGLDGNIGKVKEFYFDDQHWTVRYLAADTGSWLTGRQVLISPYAMGRVSEEKRGIAVNLTKDQIEKAPSLDTDKPVSRQFEEQYYGYYGWPTYWGDQYMWGALPYIERNSEKWGQTNEGGKPWDAHLRSTRAVTGYRAQATDGEIGHVDDFILDDENWAIRYLIIDTHNWWPGKKILLSPRWIERVSWSESKVFVNLLRETVRQSPEYTHESLPTREYEAALHSHYERLGYWET